MTPPPDPVLIDALQHQLSELTAALSALDSTRQQLAPTPEPAWRGTAHRAYVEAMRGLAASVDRADSSLRSARALTAAALRECTA